MGAEWEQDGGGEWEERLFLYSRKVQGTFCPRARVSGMCRRPGLELFYIFITTHLIINQRARRRDDNATNEYMMPYIPWL